MQAILDTVLELRCTLHTKGVLDSCLGSGLLLFPCGFLRFRLRPFAFLLESSTTSDFADTFGLFPDFPITTTATGISQGGSMRWLDPGFAGLVLATPEL